MEEFLWKNPGILHKNSQNSYLHGNVISDNFRVWAARLRQTLWRTENCILESWICHGFQWSGAWKKDCLKSEKSFHDDTNIESKVTQKNVEEKIFSSGISDPFYLSLAHVPGGNIFLWDFSLKGLQHIHCREKKIFCMQNPSENVHTTIFKAHCGPVSMPQR